MLTDGRMKYIWRPASGKEQLFDLASDPHELHDLGADPVRAGEVSAWRDRMIAQLKDRPEGFSDGTQLIAGCTYDAVLPHAAVKRER